MRRAADDRPVMRRAVRWLACLATGYLLGATAWGQGAATARSCPPVAAVPTVEQLQAAQRGARDRGLLWRLKRDGEVSYLYGTLHLGKLEWAFPGPTIRSAMAASQSLALELDLDDPAVGRAIAESVARNPKALRLSSEMQRRLARQEEAACLPPGALDSQHPILRAVTLAMLAARWEGLDPSYAQERVLGSAARAGGIPVLSLESARQQLEALIPKEEAKAIELLLQTLMQIESGVARRTTARLAQVWAEGRLDELERYEQWCECVVTEEDRAYLRRLNDDRNPTLARRIEAMHASGKRVFAAVGVMHMTGPRSLLKLLEQRGFVVERVPFGP